MKYLLILLLVAATQTAGAQKLKDLLERKKLEAKAKVDFKADIKSSEVIDSAIAAPGTVVRKAKEKKAAKKNAAAGIPPAADQQQLPPQQYPEPEGVLLVIETNILCEEGKQKIEGKFRKQPSVLEILVDPATGDLSIRVKTGSLPYSTIIEMINNAGFIADDKQPAASAPVNPCTKTT